jgi:hypothetical protein
MSQPGVRAFIIGTYRPSSSATTQTVTIEEDLAWLAPPPPTKFQPTTIQPPTQPTEIVIPIMQYRATAGGYVPWVWGYGAWRAVSALLRMD